MREGSRARQNEDTRDTRAARIGSAAGGKRLAAGGDRSEIAPRLNGFETRARV